MLHEKPQKKAIDVLSPGRRPAGYAHRVEASNNEHGSGSYPFFKVRHAFGVGIQPCRRLEPIADHGYLLLSTTLYSMLCMPQARPREFVIVCSRVT